MISFEPETEYYAEDAREPFRPTEQPMQSIGEQQPCRTTPYEGDKVRFGVRWLFREVSLRDRFSR